MEFIISWIITVPKGTNLFSAYQYLKYNISINNNINSSSTINNINGNINNTPNIITILNTKKGTYSIPPIVRLYFKQLVVVIEHVPQLFHIIYFIQLIPYCLFHMNNVGVKKYFAPMIITSSTALHNRIFHRHSRAYFPFGLKHFRIRDIFCPPVSAKP